MFRLWVKSYLGEDPADFARPAATTQRTIVDATEEASRWILLIGSP